MHQLFWALLVLTIAAILFRQDWIYFLVYVIGGVWILSHWWVRRSLRRLSVQRSLLYRAFPGEVIDVTLRFVNASWLPVPWLQVREQVPLDLKSEESYSRVISIGGKSKTTLCYTLVGKRRGYYTLGPLLLKTGDLFGFTAATWQEERTDSITIYPQVLPLHKLGLPSRSPFGTLRTQHRLHEDSTRLAGVRAYAVGDSLRRIHWKASAHEDSLLVKKFQPAIALNLTIVLDLNRHAYPERGTVGYSEWAIVVAASLASYGVGQRQAVGLVSNGLDPLSREMTTGVPTRQGQGHLMELLALLARIQSHAVEQPLAAWLPRRISDLTWGTTLVVVTPRLEENALWVLHNAYRRGSNVVVLVCAPQPDFKLRQAQAERLGIPVRRTIWESDLRELGQAEQTA